MEISKVIIITKNNKRYENLKKYFQKMGIKTIKHKYKRLARDKIDNHTTSMCSLICTNAAINNWYNHYNIWENILDNLDDNVLILEDTCVPIDNFKNTFQEYKKQFPQNYDIIFLGCAGSCDNNYKYEFLGNIINRSPKEVYLNGKELNNIIKPSIVMGMYSYLISLKGAKKLVDNPIFKKTKFDLDVVISYYLLNNYNYDIYACNPPLFYNSNTKINKIENHDILNKITGTDDDNIINYRPLGIKLTTKSLAIFFISIIAALFFSTKISYYIMALLFFYLLEITYTKTDSRKIKSIIFELMVNILIIVIILRIKNYMNKKM